MQLIQTYKSAYSTQPIVLYKESCTILCSNLNTSFYIDNIHWNSYIQSGKLYAIPNLTSNSEPR